MICRPQEQAIDRNPAQKAGSMQQKQHALIYRVILAITLGAISFLATTDIQLPVAEDISDKINHAVAFFTLALLVDFSWPKSGFRALKVLSLLGYGLAIEIIQYVLPHRSFSLFDLGADGVGMFLYGLSVPLLKNLYPLSKRFETGGEEKSAA